MTFATLEKAAPAIQAQYEEYPYPPRDPADEAKRLIALHFDELEFLNHHAYGGRRVFDQDFRVLVAGCGTGDSVVFLAEQLRELGGRVVALDISAHSLAIAQARAEQRKLTNIEWRHASLLTLSPEAYGLFDYVNCAGVLHHLPDPDAGLRALKGVLKPDGVAGIMVYAPYGRAGVYQLQALMRLINRDGPAAAEQIKRAKSVLHTLPAGHLFKLMESLIADHKAAGDAGIYDLLLHSQDRAYDVPEIYAWLERCDLTMAGLFDFHSYDRYQPGRVLREPKLFHLVSAYPEPAQQAIGELLSGDIIKQHFYASPTARSQAGLEDEMMVPQLTRSMQKPGLYEKIAEFASRCVTPMMDLRFGNLGQRIMVPMRPMISALCFKFLDGKRNLAEIYDAVIADPSWRGNPPARVEAVQAFEVIYQPMHEAGWLLLRHQSVPALAPLRDMK